MSSFSISGHDVAKNASEGISLELLSNGLTFDLAGLAPGVSGIEPAIMHRFGLSDAFDPAGCEAVSLDAGPHLAGGEALVPVIRSHLELAVELCELPGLRAVAWGPAQSLNSPAHFDSSVRRWLEGGVFPGLGLTALADDGHGGMRSEGLSFFIGQELQVSPGIALDKAGSAQLALRLIHELVEAGGLDEAQEIIGPDGGILSLEPIDGGNIVSVKRG